MIVEFIGSTGSGKTTLAHETRRRLAETGDVSTAADLVTDALRLPRLTHPTSRNMILDVAGLPFVIASLAGHRRFLAFAMSVLSRQRPLSLHAVNYARSLMRKVGAYEIARRYAGNRLILADEGTILVAHNIFVYSNTTFGQADFERFARLVPLPDAVIYVRAPVRCLVDRSVHRRDAPRRLRKKTAEQIERYVSRAVEMFDTLVASERLAGRVLVVDNPDSGGEQFDALANRVARHIRALRSDGLPA